MKKDIQKEVTFEPENALYTKDEKGLEYYEKIIKGAKDVLNEGGYLVFELGQGQSKAVENILISNSFENIEILKDLAGIDRVISGRII